MCAGIVVLSGFVSASVSSPRPHPADLLDVRNVAQHTLELHAARDGAGLGSKEILLVLGGLGHAVLEVKIDSRRQGEERGEGEGKGCERQEGMRRSKRSGANVAHWRTLR